MRGIFIGILSVLLATGTARAAGMYKCVDAQGNVAYTESRVEGSECTPVSGAGSRTGNPDAPTAAQRLERWREQQEARAEQRAAADAEEAEARQQERELAEACATARENLAILIRSNRMLLPPEEEGGEPVRMSDEDRMQRIEELRDAIAENCD